MSASPTPKRMKGTGRVSFMAQLADITAELDAGWPVKAVYEKRAQTVGISYAQFARYVEQIVKRGPRAPVTRNGHSLHAHSPTASAMDQPTPEPPPQTTVPEGSIHAGHRPARTFNHDPLEGPDDRRRLLGED